MLEQACQAACDLIAHVDYELDDRNEFTPMLEPITVAGHEWRAYCWNSMTRFPSELSEPDAVKYSMVLLRPVNPELKLSVLTEIERKKREEMYNGETISRYLATFFPYFPRTVEIIELLEDALSTRLWNEKCYRLKFMGTVVTTAQYDFGIPFYVEKPRCANAWSWLTRLFTS